MMTLEHK